MITKDYLKSQYMTLKVQREAARRQVASDELSLRESTKNLDRIDGSMNTVRNLIVAAESQELQKERVVVNGAKHS